MPFGKSKVHGEGRKGYGLRIRVSKSKKKKGGGLWQRCG